MSRPRLLFSPASNDNNSFTPISRKRLLQSQLQDIHRHIMGEEILDIGEKLAINTMLKTLNNKEKQLLQNTLKPYLPSWSTLHVNDSLSFYYQFMRMLGCVVIAAIACEFMYAATDNHPISWIFALNLSVALIGREVQLMLEQTYRNGRMYDFIDALEDCGLEVPVMLTFTELLRKMSKESAHTRADEQTARDSFPLRHA